MAGVAEKKVALAMKEATWKLGYEDAKACQLGVIAGVVSTPRCIRDSGEH